ncbi:hypothetical protein LIER_36251 [Lithospermum erythrorhizon]|uniref:Lipoprotein n=1 Tax=Lithospermum erythrorhizon TaxID=34254 RepID=A0AAV3P7V1_LITER
MQVMDSGRKNPEHFANPEKYFDDEEIEKFKKYEADYSRYLMSKYFSDKNIFGGNIFDVKMTMDGETIKASRLPQYASYADPVGFLKQISGEPTSDAHDASTNASNGGN